MCKWKWIIIHVYRYTEDRAAAADYILIFTFLDSSSTLIFFIFVTVTLFLLQNVSPTFISPHLTYSLLSSSIKSISILTLLLTMWLIFNNNWILWFLILGVFLFQIGTIFMAALKTVPIWFSSSSSSSFVSDSGHKRVGFCSNFRFLGFQKWECLSLLAQRAITPLEDEKPFTDSNQFAIETQITKSPGFHKDLNSLPSKFFFQMYLQIEFVFRMN